MRIINKMTDKWISKKKYEELVNNRKIRSIEFFGFLFAVALSVSIYLIFESNIQEKQATTDYNFINGSLERFRDAYTNATPLEKLNLEVEFNKVNNQREYYKEFKRGSITFSIIIFLVYLYFVHFRSGYEITCQIRRELTLREKENLRDEFKIKFKRYKVFLIFGWIYFWRYDKISMASVQFNKKSVVIGIRDDPELLEDIWDIQSCIKKIISNKSINCTIKERFRDDKKISHGIVSTLWRLLLIAMFFIWLIALLITLYRSI